MPACAKKEGCRQAQRKTASTLSEEGEVRDVIPGVKRRTEDPNQKKKKKKKKNTNGSCEKTCRAQKRKRNSPAWRQSQNQKQWEGSVRISVSRWAAFFDRRVVRRGGETRVPKKGSS